MDLSVNRYVGQKCYFIYYGYYFIVLCACSENIDQYVFEQGHFWKSSKGEGAIWVCEQILYFW